MTDAREVTEQDAAEGDSPAFVDLIEGEIRLDDQDELVWRHCATGHIDARTGQPTDLMFRDTEADAGKMSGSRESKATAEESNKHRTEVLNKAVAGTWALSVQEIEEVRARAVDDGALQPEGPPDPAPGHTYIDVRHLGERTRRERERFRSTLLIFANNRGRQYPGSDAVAQGEPSPSSG
ncbi:hypothetical protein [Clavibacter nebraskensis]|uniref:hypothetical protein n=1 Tax=Clavibacter nebraskensis TaxID=31963 RepID=UPI003DA7053D